MQNFNLDQIAGGIVAVLTVLGIVWGALQGKRKGDGKAPLERPPTPHEMKEAIQGLHDHLRRLSRKLDTMDDGILEETRKIRDGLREIEHWQRLSDARLNWRPPQ